MGLDVWEARFASRGGVYYFVRRGRDIVPISDLGKEVERDSTARGPRIRYAVELPQDDAIMEVEVGSAKATRKGRCGYLHVRIASIVELQGKPQEEWHAILRDAPEAVLGALLTSPNVPSWMKGRIKSWGSDARGFCSVATKSETGQFLST
jgi:hypothetical protein